MLQDEDFFVYVTECDQPTGHCPVEVLLHEVLILFLELNLLLAFKNNLLTAGKGSGDQIIS